MKKYVTLFLSSAITEVLIAFYMLTLTNHQIFLCVLLTFLLPWLQFLSYKWFIEATTTKERVWQTLTTALGFSMGVLFVLLW